MNNQDVQIQSGDFKLNKVNIAFLESHVHCVFDDAFAKAYKKAQTFLHDSLNKPTMRLAYKLQSLPAIESESSHVNEIMELIEDDSNSQVTVQTSYIVGLDSIKGGFSTSVETVKDIYDRHAGNCATIQYIKTALRPLLCTISDMAAGVYASYDGKLDQMLFVFYFRTKHNEINTLSITL